MGLDITFFKTKRSDFKNLIKLKFDDNGDNIHKDKEIYYFRGNYNLKNYIQSIHKFDINNKIIELDINTISSFKGYMPEHYTINDTIYFQDKLSEAINKGYVVYVECNY